MMENGNHIICYNVHYENNFDTRLQQFQSILFDLKFSFCSSSSIIIIICLWYPLVDTIVILYSRILAQNKNIFICMTLLNTADDICNYTFTQIRLFSGSSFFYYFIQNWAFILFILDLSNINKLIHVYVKITKYTIGALKKVTAPMVYYADCVKGKYKYCFLFFVIGDLTFFGKLMVLGKGA